MDPTITTAVISAAVIVAGSFLTWLTNRGRTSVDERANLSDDERKFRAELRADITELRKANEVCERAHKLCEDRVEALQQAINAHIRPRPSED